MVKGEYKFSEITETIIGCAMRVHRKLGNGFPEVIYQRALRIEMTNAKLSFQEELSKQIYYDGVNIGSRRVDFLVEDKILVELKAVSLIENIHISQVLNYLEAFDVEIGLLLNFGHTSLQVKRLIRTPFRQ